MLLVVAALVHFLKYRSGNFIWLYVIIFLGPIGAVVYFIVEVLPELRSSNAGSGWLAKVLYRMAHGLGRYEELAELYRERGDFGRAREAFNHAITSRTDFPDPFYGRAMCALALNDVAAAIADLEKVLSFDRKHDYYRAMGVLAHCYAMRGDNARAEALFREALQTSTLSETQYNYAEWLASQGRAEEARDLCQRILSKRATLSGPLRRDQEPWFKRADALLRRLAAVPAASR